MERELNASIQQQITKENPYQRINESSFQSKAAPHQPPPARKEPLQLFMIDALFRKWDQAAQPKDAKKIFSPSVADILEFLKLLKSAGDEFSGQRELIGIMAYGLRFAHQLDQRGYVFFVTASGFIGTGPADLDKDDTIVLLHGSNFPVAPRRTTNGHWNFVGFVYVRGIVNEELFDCFEDLDLKETKFVLE